MTRWPDYRSIKMGCKMSRIAKKRSRMSCRTSRIGWRYNLLSDLQVGSPAAD
jgi:hypothetical protein